MVKLVTLIAIGLGALFIEKPLEGVPETCGAQEFVQDSYRLLLEENHFEGEMVTQKEYALSQIMAAQLRLKIDSEKEREQKSIYIDSLKSLCEKIENPLLAVKKN